jgi:hypothetical protein
MTHWRPILGRGGLLALRSLTLLAGSALVGTATAIAGPAGGGNVKTRDDDSPARQDNSQDPTVGCTVSLRLAGSGPEQDVTYAVDDAKASGAPHLSGVTVTDLDGEATVGPLTLPSGRPGVLTYPNADPGQQSASRSGPSTGSRAPQRARLPSLGAWPGA